MYSLEYTNKCNKLYITRDLKYGGNGMCIEINSLSTEQINKLYDILKQEIKRRENEATNINQM